jgi:hypothetical protein
MRKEVAVNHFHMCGLRKTRKTSRHDSRLEGRELNLGPPEHEVEVYVCPFYHVPEHGMSQRMQASYTRKLLFSGTK